MEKSDGGRARLSERARKKAAQACAPAASPPPPLFQNTPRRAAGSGGSQSSCQASPVCACVCVRGRGCECEREQTEGLTGASVGRHHRPPDSHLAQPLLDRAVAQRPALVVGQGFRAHGARILGVAAHGGGECGEARDKRREKRKSECTARGGREHTPFFCVLPPVRRPRESAPHPRRPSLALSASAEPPCMSGGGLSTGTVAR